jgi:hypothetical protein
MRMMTSWNTIEPSSGGKNIVPDRNETSQRTLR